MTVFIRVAVTVMVCSSSLSIVVLVVHLVLLKILGVEYLLHAFQR